MNARSMAGWIGFAGIVMVILGGLNFFEGLIALLRDNYYVATGEGFIVFDVTAWGWIMLIWGALLYRSRSARWRKLGAVDVDRVGGPQRVWPTRLPGQHERPAVDADHADVEHHRALRTDRPLGRERAAVRLESP